MNNTLSNKTLLVPAQSAEQIQSRYKWISLDLVEPSLGAPLITPLSSTNTFILSSNNLGTERGWIEFTPFDSQNLIVTNLSAQSISAESIITNFLSAISATFINRVTENQNITGTLTVAGTLNVDGTVTADKSFFQELTAINFELGKDGGGYIFADTGIFDSLSAKSVFLDAISGDGRLLNPVGDLIFNRPQTSARMFSISLPITGDNNLYFGLSATPVAKNEAQNNIVMGNRAGFINEIGSENIILGRDSGFRNASSFNVYIGTNAGKFNQLGEDNVVIGRESGSYSTASNSITGRRTVILGSFNKSKASNNIILGYNNETNFNSNVVVLGSNKNTLYDNEIIIGDSIVHVQRKINNLFVNTVNSLTGVNNTFLNNSDEGGSPGEFTLSANNIFIGTGAGRNNKGGMSNIFIGSYAGRNYTGNGYFNVNIGLRSGENYRGDETANVNIGTYTSLGSGGFSNTVIGFSAQSMGFNNGIILGREAKADRNNRFIVSREGLEVEGTVFGTLSATQRLFSPRIDAFEMYTTSLTSLSHVLEVFRTNVYVSTLSGLTSTDFLYLTGALEAGSLSARTLSGDGSDLNPIGPFRWNRNTNSLSTWLSSSNNLSLGIDNVFIGRQAGVFNTAGSGNNFIGRESGISNTAGSYNSFIGWRAGKSNTVGVGNLFLGYNSGRSNTTGLFNVFLGGDAGLSNSTGSYNVFIGAFAGVDNTVGYSNVFLSRSAGENNTVGRHNVFLGDTSGFQNKSGSRNILLGFEAGYNNITGWNNTILGTGAGVSTSNLSGVIVLGTNATASASQQFIVGSWTDPVTGRIFGPLTVDSLSAQTEVRALSVITSVLNVDTFNIGSFDLDDFTADNITTTGLTATQAVLSGDGYGLNPVGLLKFDRIRNNAGMFNMDVIAPRGGSNNLAFGVESGKGLYSGNSNIYIGNKAGSLPNTLNEQLSNVRITNAGQYTDLGGQFTITFQGNCVSPASAVVAASLPVGGFTNVESITITNNGLGYEVPPTASILYLVGGVSQVPVVTALAVPELYNYIGSNTILIGNSAQGAMYSNSIAIGTYANPKGDNSLAIGSEYFPLTSATLHGPLDVKGHFSAVTKSFLIKHPIKKNKHLQYGSLEGPELGVYYRGKTNKNIIKLPSVWEHLVDTDSITVQLTPVGKEQNLYVISYSNKEVAVKNVSGYYFYTIYGERKDVPRLEVEV